MKKAFICFTAIVCLCACKKAQDEAGPIQSTEAAAPAKNIDSLKNNDFEATVSSVLKAFETKNDSLANSFVSPGHGVMIVYRTGVFNEYKTIDKIDFDNPVPHNFAYSSFNSNDKLKFEALPKFNCGEMKWDKHGLYCDTIRKDTLLSGTPQNLIKYRGDKIADAEVQKLKQLEAKSRRIVLALPDKDFIFYMTLIDNEWYLTAIDRITTDCSA